MKESTLKMYAYEIIKTLCILHKNNIIHCDVKPTNFLIFPASSKVKVGNLMDSNADLCIVTDNSSDYSFNTYEDENDTIIKLTDFGLAHIIPEGEQLAYAKFICGTHAYKAPELKNVIIDFYNIRILILIRVLISGRLEFHFIKWLPPISPKRSKNSNMVSLLLKE